MNELLPARRGTGAGVVKSVSGKARAKGGGEPSPAEARSRALADFVRARPHRKQALAAIHERPPIRLAAPLELTLLAYDTVPVSREEELGHAQTLVPAQLHAPDASDHWSAEYDGVGVRLERHTTFTTYLFIERSEGVAPFAKRPLEKVPADWIAGIPGQLAVALRICVATAETVGDNERGVAIACGSDDYVGSRILGGRADVWTDLQDDIDGFVKILLVSHELDERQTGLLVQYLTEIECYRTFALLALPFAQRVNADLDALEKKLATITHDLQLYRGTKDRQEALEKIIGLASAGEALAGMASALFSAADAYATIVNARLADLHEESQAGRQTLSEFIGRRFGPAVRTIETAARRLREFESIVARTADLLRTAVEVSVEQQNRDLLTSMDKRAQLQLRLQQTVEGLSVAAISYYAIGVGKYFFEGLKAAHMAPAVPEWLVAVAVPAVVIAVWAVVLRIRKRHEGR